MIANLATDAVQTYCRYPLFKIIVHKHSYLSKLTDLLSVELRALVIKHKLEDQ